MSPRWDWEFEEEKRPKRPDTATASSPLPAVEASPPAKAPNRVHIRRRRAGAAAIVVAVLVILIAALTGSAQRTPKVSSSSATVRQAPAAPALTPAQVKAGEDRAVSSVLAFTPFVKEGGSSGRDIALTFDDGPGPYTPQVLSVERLHVHGTFFVIGKMLRYFSESTAREIRDGDVIGDHTESHPMMASLSAHDQHEELFEQIARIELLDGPRPTLFRPPYGSFDATTLHELHAMHLLMVLWSVDTDDYQQPGVPVIVERALEGAHPGAIILLHDAGGVRTQTIAALPIIIAKLRAKGYDLVTVPQLLKDDPPPAGQPIPPNLSGD